MYLGIEIGGTKLQVGVGRGGRIERLERRSIDPERGAEGILDQVLECAGCIFRESDLAAIEAIGIGYGGPVDARSGLTIRSHQVLGWENFPLADWARKELGVSRVAVENDADTAALAEAVLGAGRGFSPVLYVTIGSGIGGGLIVEGGIYRGAGLGAIEIGHLKVDRPGEAERILESIASGWGIGQTASRMATAGELDPAGPLGRLASANGGRLTAKEVAAVARGGDESARRILAEAAEAFGIGLAHAVTLLGPQRVILGGGVSLMGEELWFCPVRLVLQARVFPEFRGRFEVVPAELGEEVVIHGALLLAEAS